MKNSSFTFLAGMISIMCLASFYCAKAQNWSYISGIQAQDIAVGKNGSVWATGTNHAIYRWNGSYWETMPGGAERIAVDPEGAAWVVNLGGDIYKYNLAIRNWELKPGNAKDIGVGGDGSVWVIGSNVVQGGYGIYKWNGSNWTNIPGGAVRVAVDPSGNAWVINNSSNVFRYNGSSFELKPGAVKDIGVGANGTIWCTGTDDRIYQWDGSNWKMQTGGASQISVAPDGNAWVVNAGGQVYHTTNAVSAFVQVRTIFTRGQTYEYRMLQALKMFPYSNTISLGGTTPLYSSIDPLGQAFGRLGLQASEIYFATNSTITADQILSQVGSYTDDRVRKGVWGVLAILVMNEVTKNSTDAQVTALKTWSTNLFRSIKVRCAKSVLDEYQKWKYDPCGYTAEGYTRPPDCALGGLNFTQWYGTHSPPSDIIGKAGLKMVLANNADAIVSGTAIGLAAVAMVGSFIAASSGLGVIVGSTIVNTTGAAITLSLTSLSAAFGGSGGMAGAAGAIGAASWGGVVAAPIAAAVLAIIVGTIEGIRVVENAKIEPMLKMKLGAAMTEYINITNVMADSSAAQMFYVGFQEAAQKGFQVTQPQVDGEVRFYCQAGYVSSFRLSYTLNGQAVTKTTKDLSVGYEETFSIPYNAANIQVQGWYALAGWKELFNLTLNQPTYICYTSYGTVIQPAYKTDCPEVGNMTTTQNQLTVTQGGGYVAWIRLEYNEGGQTKRVLDKSDCGGGWRQVFTIPSTATNIHLQAWSNTGWIGEPWKTIIDRSWPSPPNECIKVYNTTLDPKWNNECN